MNNLELTAVQCRNKLAMRHFPQGMTPDEIHLLDDVQQLLIKVYRAGAEASNGQHWSNQAALGYTIMAAERIGLSEEQIQQLVRSMHNRFDFKSLEEAAEHYRQSAY